METLIALIIIILGIRAFISIRKGFLNRGNFNRRKFNKTIPKYGPQVPLAFNIDETEFLYDYLQRSMEIAEHNNKEANASMLREIKRKLMKATFAEALVRHNAEQGNYREFERNGEFS